MHRAILPRKPSPVLRRLVPARRPRRAAPPRPHDPAASPTTVPARSASGTATTDRATALRCVRGSKGAWRRPASTSRVDRSACCRSHACSATASTRSASGGATVRPATCARSSTRSRTRSASGTTTWCRSRPEDVIANGRGASVRTAFAKELYVSPFIDMEATYDFTTREPDDRVSVVVRESTPGGRVLIATLGARRLPLTGRTLLHDASAVPAGHPEGDRGDPLGGVEALAQGRSVPRSRSAACRPGVDRAVRVLRR